MAKWENNFNEENREKKNTKMISLCARSSLRKVPVFLQICKFFIIIKVSL